MSQKHPEQAWGGAGAGVFGVEMFLLEDGELLLNEVAPRSHNSGHCIEPRLRVCQGLP